MKAVNTVKESDEPVLYAYLGDEKRANKHPRRMNQATRMMDNLATNLGELFRRELEDEKCGDDYETIFKRFDDFFREQAREIANRPFIKRYFWVNFDFFKETYGVLQTQD
jgi:hypothetical protein